MSDAVTIPVSAVVTVTDAGRAVVPTLRSLAAGRAVPAQTVVVADDADTMRELLADAGLVATVVQAGPRRSSQRNAGIAASTNDVVAILDAGDLADEEWIGTAARGWQHSIRHPELVVAFGDRSARWRQAPADADEPARMLPVVTPWASPVVVARDLLDAIPFPDVDDDVVDAAWQAASLTAGVPHEVVDETSVFVRVRGRVAPWERALGAVISNLPAAVRAQGGAAFSAPRPLPPAVRRGRRIAAALLDPWRRGMTRLGRRIRRGSAFPEWISERWRRLNVIEPLVPYPRPAVADTSVVVGSPWSSEERRTARLYARVAARLPERVDYVFFAPWLRLGGGDKVLVDYIDAVTRLDPDARVALITTEPVASTRIHTLPLAVTALELRDIVDLASDRELVVDRILPQLLGQLDPATIHAFNSTVAFDVVERYGAPSGAAVFLSTFAVDRTADGESTSVLFLRRPGFLDDVHAVLVDSAGFVDRMVREQGYRRDRFRVHRHVIRPIERTADPQDALHVLWVGRFDIPKRLDVLARIAAASRAEGLPVVFEFYGEEVMGDPSLAETLEALQSAGARRHPPFDGFYRLPLGRFGAYVLTSEWEGIPNSLLEAMSAGVVVIAPRVGGIPEVLDETTGYPIDRFDDVEGYLEALRSIIGAPLEAAARASRAQQLVREEFSSAAFDAHLASTPGYLRPVALRR